MVTGATGNTDEARQKAAASEINAILHPEKEPLPTAGQVADALEKAATKLKNATLELKEANKTKKALTTAKEALTEAKNRAGAVPGVKQEVATLVTEVNDLAEDD